MLSEGTWNQLKWAEAHNKTIGIVRDHRNKSSKKEGEIKLNVTGNEEFWDKCDQVVIVQGEFNSVGLAFMHFMDPELNYKTNPYKVMKVWVDIGGKKKEQMYGIQQIYQDSIRCKLIGTPKQVEGVKSHKRFEEDISWEDELARIQAYSGNELHRGKEAVKRMANNMGGIENVRITTVDDYDIEYEIESDWHRYGKVLKHSRRKRYLEEQLIKVEDKLYGMDPIEKRFYRVMAEEMGVTGYDIDERHLLAEDSMDIAKRFDTHPGEVWKAFYVHIEPWVRKELEWIENNL